MGFIKVLGIIFGVGFLIGCLAFVVVNVVSIVKTLIEKKKKSSNVVNVNAKDITSNDDRKEK